MSANRVAWLAAAASLLLIAGSAHAQQGTDNEGRKEGEEENPPPPPPAAKPKPPVTDGDDEAPKPKKKKKYENPEAEGDYDEPWVTGTARLADRFYEGGPFIGMGGPLAVQGLNSPVMMSGVRVLENHGYISKILIGTLVAMGQGNSAYVGSTYHTDYRGNTWRTDYYRPLTAAERERNAQNLRDAINSEYVMELNVYASGLPGLGNDESARARGFEFYLGGQTTLGSGGSLPTILQIAFAGSAMRTPNAEFKPGFGRNQDGQQAPPNVLHRDPLYYANVGVMLRAYIPITRWLEGYAQWDLNILSLFDFSGKRLATHGMVWTSPLRAGINVNLTDRAYVRAHGSLNGFGGYGIGWLAEAGIRF